MLMNGIDQGEILGLKMVEEKEIGGWTLRIGGKKGFKGKVILSHNKI